MSKKKREHIKKIINIKSADKAPADFTSKVMQDVFVLANDEALKDVPLENLLKRVDIDEPSHDFLSSVMSQVDIKKEIQYQPLISKKAWFVIFGAVIAVVLFSSISNTTNESVSTFNKISPYVDQAQQLFTNLFKNITFSPLLTISLLCLSSMLLFDAFLKRKLFSLYN